MIGDRGWRDALVDDDRDYERRAGAPDVLSPHEQPALREQRLKDEPVMLEDR